MSRITKTLVLLSLAVTCVALATWLLTGGDYYTKFEVVEQVERAVEPGDPLSGTGFYDGDTLTTAEVRPSFRFGLLPVPSRLFDKHMLAVVTVVPPFWVLTLGVWWWGRRR